METREDDGPPLKHRFPKCPLSYVDSALLPQSQKANFCISGMPLYLLSPLLYHAGSLAPNTGVSRTFGHRTAELHLWALVLG